MNLYIRAYNELSFFDQRWRSSKLKLKDTWHDSRIWDDNLPTRLSILTLNCIQLLP